MYTLISDHSIITTILLPSHSYHCRAFIFSVETEAFSIFCPFKVAVQKFNTSADLKKIKTAIEASHLKTKHERHVLVKIALENCLCEFLIPQAFQYLSLIYLI
jgi:hypothetical protein